MSGTLGICVATKSRMEHVIGLARAARKAGREVEVFFTGEGVLLTQDPRFRELLDVAKTGSSKPHGQVTVCEVSYMAQGLTAGKATSGLRDKDFVTQGKNAEMVEECERYVVL
ncbi:MAG TPA: DsrE family protein [Anaeromyxobacter sp.]|nr:DsrE family protein [Anaeromyxobacter sp.]